MARYKAVQAGISAASCAEPLAGCWERVDC